MTSEQPRPRADWHKAMPLIVLVGLWVYANSLTKVFLLDDLAWIQQNYDLGELSAYVKIGTRMLPNLSVVFNHWLGGKAVLGYHVFNMLVHIAAALTLFGLLRRTLELPQFRDYFGERSAWLALSASLLWMVHPLQTQSVTYVIQRAEAMMGLFYLLTLYCLVRAGTAARPGRWSILCVLCCLLGMMCKEVMATAPILAFLYDRTFLAGSFLGAVRRRWGLYLGMVSTWAVLAYGILTAPPNPTVGFGTVGITPMEYVMTQPGVILYYLRLSFWPAPLCLDYEIWPITRDLGSAVLPALGLGVLLLATVWGLIWRPWLGFVGAWFFVILGPTSSIMPLKDVAFEHRMYLSLAAVVVLVVLAGDALLARLDRAGQGGVLKVGLVTLAVAVLGALTIRRNEDYRSAEVMWSNVLAQWPDAPRALINLGAAYQSSRRFEEARELYQQVLEKLPNAATALANLGFMAFAEGDLPRARRYLERVARPGPLEKAMYYGALGDVLYLQGDREKAVAQFRRALQLEPRNPTYHYKLGTILRELGNHDQASAHLAEGKRLDPAYPRQAAQTAWRMALSGKRPQMKEAIFLARVACMATEFRDWRPLDVLATTLATDGDFDQAVYWSSQALPLVEREGRSEDVRAVRRRLSLFRQKLPFQLTHLARLP